MTVSVSGSVLLSSVSDSDFTIDGNDATGFTVMNDDTVISLPDHRRRRSQRLDQRRGRPSRHGAHSGQLHLPDRRHPSVRRLQLDRRRRAFPGPADRGHHVQRADSALVGQYLGYLALHGEVRGISYTPSSFSFDPTDTILTINYANLPTDAYQFA